MTSTAWAPARAWRAARVLELGARLAFAATILALPLRARLDPLPHPTWAVSAIFGDLLLFAVDVCVAATVGLWLGARLLDRRPIRLGPRAVWLPAGALVALAWLTAPLGLHPEFSLLVAMRLTLVVLLALYVVNDVEGLAGIALPLGLMLAIEAAVVVAQAVRQGPVGLAALGETPIDVEQPGASVVALPDGTRLFRAYGLAGHPNALGGVLACGSLLLLGAGAWRRRAAVGARMAIVAAAVLALLLTFSRGGWLAFLGGLAVGIAMLLVAGRRTVARQWLAALSLGAVLVLGAGWVLRDAVAVRVGLGSEVPATETRSIDERLAQIGLGLRVVAADPLTGAGIGAMAPAMEALDPDFEFGLYPPHVVLLTATGELGLLGGVALAALFAAPWLLLSRGRGRWTPELAAATAAVAAVELASLVDFYPWVGGLGRTLTWLVLGLWVLAYERAQRRGTLDRGTTP